MDLVPIEHLSPDSLGSGNRAALRRRALTAFAQFDLPDESDELWRYTDLAGRVDFSRLAVAPLVDGDAIARIERPADIAAGTAIGEMVPTPAGAASIENGRLAVVGADAGEAVEIERIEIANPTPMTDPSRDKFTALATAVGDGVSIRTADGAVVGDPLLVHVTVTESAIVAPALIRIDLGKASEATLLVLVDGPAAGSLVLPITDIHLGAGSTLRHVVLGFLGREAVEIASTSASLERDAHLRTGAAGFGGSLSRLHIVSSMEGEGSESEMLGVFFGDGSQHFDYRTFQDHRAPRTQSDLLYKGAVDDHASSVYSGLVRVEKNAQKIVGFQANRNLVLSDDASAESIPNLEILANDVRCSHASATGPLDEGERFYLESRGIAPAVAERLLVQGFFEEVISRFPVPEVAPAIRSAVEDKFSHHGGESG